MACISVNNNYPHVGGRWHHILVVVVAVWGAFQMLAAIEKVTKLCVPARATLTVGKAAPT